MAGMKSRLAGCWILLEELEPSCRMAVMGEKKKDRHQQRATLVRLPEPVRLALERLANRNLSTISEEIRRAILAWLIQSGDWPPPEEQATQIKIL
jgi:hypothetical protein